MKRYLLATIIGCASFPASARIVFEQPPARPQGACIVADPTGTLLNVRTGPSIKDGVIVDKLENGTVVEIIQQQRDWAFVHYEGNHAGAGWEAGAGWVYTGFLKNCRAEAAP